MSARVEVNIESDSDDDESIFTASSDLLPFGILRSRLPMEDFKQNVVHAILKDIEYMYEDLDRKEAIGVFKAAWRIIDGL